MRSCIATSNGRASCSRGWVRRRKCSSRLGLGAGVVDPYTRHAALLAQAGATLAEMAPGRFRVIMGRRDPFVTLPGYGNAPPVPALREAAELMRQLWQGERITLDGEVVRFDDGALDWKPSAVPSLCLASRDPEILAVAGEIADGVMIEGFSTATGIQHAKEPHPVRARSIAARLEGHQAHCLDPSLRARARRGASAGSPHARGRRRVLERSHDVGGR